MCEDKLKYNSKSDQIIQRLASLEASLNRLIATIERTIPAEEKKVTPSDE